MFIQASKRKRGRPFPLRKLFGQFPSSVPFPPTVLPRIIVYKHKFHVPLPIAAPSADYHPSLKLADVAAWRWRQSINIDILQRAKGTVMFCSDFGLTLTEQSRNLLSVSAELRVHSRPASTDSGGRGSGWLQPRCALHGNGWVCKTEQRRRRRPDWRTEAE